MISISLDTDNVALIFPKRHLGREAFAVYRQATEGAMFNFERKVNLAGIEKVPTIIRRLRDAKMEIELDEPLIAKLREHTAMQWLDLQGARERAAALDEMLAKRGQSLYNFQKVGIDWLAPKTSALLADDMGLGKTVQTICALPANPRLLIVSPAVAKGTWRRELVKWGRDTLRMSILSGRGNFHWPEAGEVVIVNYDILPDVHLTGCKDKQCKGCDPTHLSNTPKGVTLVGDELHLAKSSKAARAKKFRALAQSVRDNGGRTWGLTATPLLNKPPELWAIFQALGLAQVIFGSWKQFQQLFDAGHNGYGTVWGQAAPEVGERIKRGCLRRIKTEVLKDLPAKRVTTIPVDVDKATLKACDALLTKYGGADNISTILESGSIAFDEFSKVRAKLATAKIPALLELVESFEEAEEPLVVFSDHRAPIDTLGEREGWVTITGDTPPEERSQIESDFQGGKYKGVACTIKAGGVAITLTRAANSLFVDQNPTPALNSQAQDRIYRIGQERPVLIQVLTAAHPLDERINELLILKQTLIQGSVEEARERPADANQATVEAEMKATEEAVEAAIAADRARRAGPSTKPEADTGLPELIEDCPF